MSALDQELPPQKVHLIRESKASGDAEPFYNNYKEGVPIAIDFGSDTVRAGLTNASEPCNIFPNIVAKHRDRKSNYTLTLIGNDVYRESVHFPTLRTGAKSPFDNLMITNWDSVESILDYSLEHLSITSDNGCLNNPVIMTEAAGAPFTYRKGMYEILFEAYRAPKVAFGIDSLFSFYANSKKKDGLVVSVGNNLTHLIPVLGGKGILTNCKRIDWGGEQQLLFLQKALALKYPYFPTRLTNDHTKNIVCDHAYVAQDYASELSTILDMETLEKKDVVIQVPVDIAPEKAKKSEEELARQAEKRKEQGKRLQEQAQKKRLETLMQKEKEHAYYTELRDTISSLSKNEAERRVIAEEFENVADLHKYIATLEKAIKRSKGLEIEEPEEEVDPASTWPLAEIPDSDLNDEEIKEKRRQKLLKSNYEARVRIREEKKREEEEQQLYLKEQEEWRIRDLEGWCNAKRLELAQCISEYKIRLKAMDAMKDRKSMAAQQRMKNIADLASDQASGAAAKKRRRAGPSATIDNDPNDTFGTNDADWNAYRDISNASLEEEQESTLAEINRIELELLDFDPDFHTEDTFAASEKFDWRNLVLHKFIHGPRPNLTLTMQAEGHDPEELLKDPEIIRRNHQIHINVERIRVPEVYFQPQIAGLDQAGIPEIIQNILLRNFDGIFDVGGQLRQMMENIFLTGGGTLLPNFADRLKSEITSFLPTGAPINVCKANDPLLDAWKGMQKWSSASDAKENYVTRKEYDENGPEYIKEHGLGNVSLREL
ncbi:actin-like ATPase domain-containing protein [Metschnikowia bicuspidata var. bicuspidata NRRL YB-4993]|uniref:Actin-like ATPase domain-containing protein n=1 Tax=Metschnikowia bicuspidata var. bicuspidata NRRL YB-4993 TaxID=869754 RepID=A0A1A0HHL0_9ASCO|nr:actin-like ATPase domain-containing protein [Metschnikowia bicuspidata var. bicuspidata NRRL YB-4993]OBA23649.1 actin-like ATPase domain-containing protein [Metschnikowia bicuspidata var. bicuspidata NRRL YB-4993]